MGKALARGVAGLLGGTSLAMLTLAAASSPAIAQEIPEEELFDLGTLGGLQSGAFQTDADGSTVLGYAQTADNKVRLVVWRNGTITDITPEGALLALNAIDRGGSRTFVMSRDGSTVTGYFSDNGTVAVVIRDGVVTRLTGADFLSPRLISNDGKVVAGLGGNFGGPQQGFYYDDGGLHWLQDLGRSVVTTGSVVRVSGMSSDGSVIVGADNTGDQRAVRWTSGAIEDLGVLPGGVNSAASDVSADGSVVVGFSNIEYSQGFILPEAFIWRDGVMTGLGFLNNTDEPGNNQSAATAISGDGSTVIGSARWRNEAGTTLPQGFVWRDGVMQNIGVIPTNAVGGPFATVSAVSFDGHAIVGQARSMDYAMEAFLWRDGEITLLGTLPGGLESYSTDISDDGSTVVGASRNAEGNWRAFIWRTQMQDFTNILASFGGIAEETEAALVNPRERLRRVERPGCDGGGQLVCLGAGFYGWRAGSGFAGADSEETGAVLSAGLRPHRLLQLGATLALGDSSSDLLRSGADESRAWSGWIRLADVEQRGGPSLEAWYARSHDRLAIDRTAGVIDVQQALGSATLRGESFGVRAGYGLPLGDDWVLAPTISIARINFERDAYAENASDFPASYDALSLDETRGNLGASLVGNIGGGALSLVAEVEHDLDRDAITVVGQSEIPGAETFSLPSGMAGHSTRGRFEAGYSIPLGPVRLGLHANVATPRYLYQWQFGGGASLEIAF